MHGGERIVIGLELERPETPLAVPREGPGPTDGLLEDEGCGIGNDRGLTHHEPRVAPPGGIGEEPSAPDGTGDPQMEKGMADQVPGIGCPVKIPSTIPPHLVTDVVVEEVGDAHGSGNGQGPPHGIAVGPEGDGEKLPRLVAKGCSLIPDELVEAGSPGTLRSRKKCRSEDNSNGRPSGPPRDSRKAHGTRSNRVGNEVAKLWAPGDGKTPLGHLNEGAETDGSREGQEPASPAANAAGHEKVPQQQGKNPIGYPMLELVPGKECHIGLRRRGVQGEPENDSSPHSRGDRPSHAAEDCRAVLVTVTMPQQRPPRPAQSAPEWW